MFYFLVFLYLQIVVRSAVIITLLVLAIAFGVFFFQNWRVWDQNNQSKPVIKVSNDDSDEDDEFYEEIDPMLKKKLLLTRRKSVSFSVCVVDRDKMTFDLDRKRVLLGLGASADKPPGTLPTLVENCEGDNHQQPVETDHHQHLVGTDHHQHHLPLVLPKKPQPSKSRTRRMSVPEGVLSVDDNNDEKGGVKGIKFSNSIETMI